MKIIAQAEEPGVVVFVNTMRPNSIATRLGLKTSEGEDANLPLREYGVGAQILRELGVRKMIFLSDTKPTRVAGLEGYGMQIEGWRTLTEENN